MSDEIKNDDVIETTVSEEKVEEVKATVEEAVSEPIVEAPVVVEAAPAVEENTIVLPSSGSDEVKGLAPVANGVIGSTTTKREKKAAKPVVSAEPTVEKVAIRSSKNVVWQGVGKVTKGINIVTKDQADQWLTRSHIELLSPEEVAKEFGN